MFTKLQVLISFIPFRDRKPCEIEDSASLLKEESKRPNKNDDAGQDVGPIRGKRFHEVQPGSSLLSPTLARLAIAAKGVGAIMNGSNLVCVGCRVSEGLVITPKHGLRELKKNPDRAAIKFHYYNDNPTSTSCVGEELSSSCPLDMAKFLYESHTLDYALIAMQEKPLDKVTIQKLASLVRKEDLLGTHVHMFAFSKDFTQYSIVNNEVIQLKYELSSEVEALVRDPNIMFYIAKTFEGCSGSPLFNDKVEIVGFHCGTKTLKNNSTGDSFRISYGLLARSVLKELYVTRSGKETLFQTQLKESNMASQEIFPHAVEELMEQVSKEDACM